MAWWLIFFMVLPWGVHTPADRGLPSDPGHADSAPLQPRLGLKAGITTLLAGLASLAWYSFQRYWFA